MKSVDEILKKEEADGGYCVESDIRGVGIVVKKGKITVYGGRWGKLKLSYEDWNRLIEELQYVNDLAISQKKKRVEGF